MSTEGRLGAKKLRKAEAIVGEPLLRAFAWHPYVDCVTPDDRHFQWNTGTGEVRQIGNSIHYTTCPLRNVTKQEHAESLGSR